MNLDPIASAASMGTYVPRQRRLLAANGTSPADPLVPADVLYRSSSLSLAQHPDDLLLREATLSHDFSPLEFEENCHSDRLSFRESCQLIRQARASLVEL